MSDYPRIRILERFKEPGMGFYLHVGDFREYLQWLAETAINEDRKQDADVLERLDKAIIQSMVHRRGLSIDSQPPDLEGE